MKVEYKGEDQMLLDLIAERTPATQKAYKGAYKKLKGLTEQDIGDTSQKKLIKLIEEQENINTQQSLLNIAILIRKAQSYKVDILEKEREKNKKKLVKDVQEKNANLELPTLNDLYNYLDKLFEDSEYNKYVINYLLIELNVRNADLVLDIVLTKKATKEDPDKNYIWLDMKKRRCYYIRKDYKTAKTYGNKEHVITDQDFYTAVKKVYYKQKKEGTKLIPNENQAGYYVQKATLDELGEGNYFKIIVNSVRGNLQALKKLSENRGTDVNTIMASYDIDLK